MKILLYILKVTQTFSSFVLLMLIMGMFFTAWIVLAQSYYFYS